MDGTAEGIQQAAATREALRKRKRADGGDGGEEVEGGAGAEDATPAAAAAPAPASLKNRPPPTCTHEVALPEGYDPKAAGLDPKIYGEEKKPGEGKAPPLAAAASRRRPPARPPALSTRSPARPPSSHSKPCDFPQQTKKTTKKLSLYI